MVLKCLIIDDEQPAREELSYLLADDNEIEITDQADSVSKALRAIKKYEPDFIFLDIQMPGKNGFDLIHEMKGFKNPPLVVFVTAYDQYAVTAFEKNAVDYILKPFSRKRLEKSILRIKEILQFRDQALIEERVKNLIETTTNLRKTKKIPVEHGGRVVLLNPGEIVFCRYSHKRIEVHTRTKHYLLYNINTLDQLETHLPESPFFRSHRNTILNMDHIKEFCPWVNGRYSVTMDDVENTELVITRDRVKFFKQQIGI